MKDNAVESYKDEDMLKYRHKQHGNGRMNK